MDMTVTVFECRHEGMVSPLAIGSFVGGTIELLGNSLPSVTNMNRFPPIYPSLTCLLLYLGS